MEFQTFMFNINLVFIFPFTLTHTINALMKVFVLERLHNDAYQLLSVYCRYLYPAKVNGLATIYKRMLLSSSFTFDNRISEQPQTIGKS